MRVRVSAAAGCTVQIMAERADGTMSIDDCELASRTLSPVLDVADPIEKAYRLEISSPGHRPAAGAQVRLRALCRPRGARRDGCAYRWPQTLPRQADGTEGEAAKLHRDDAAEGEAADVVLPIEQMSEAKLVLTDDLVTEALRKEKAAERAMREARKQERREARQARHRPQRPAVNGGE